MMLSTARLSAFARSFVFVHTPPAVLLSVQQDHKEV